jgi:hypothetical protein
VRWKKRLRGHLKFVTGVDSFVGYLRKHWVKYKDCLVENILVEALGSPARKYTQAPAAGSVAAVERAAVAAEGRRQNTPQSG